MSEAPSSSEPLAEAAANPAPARTDVGADAALILAALGRLEAAVRDGREVLARLRVCLGDMAKAIVKAKAMADSPIAVSLLDEFEHRIDAMIEIAGVGDDGATPGQVAAEAAEADQVPTVTGVVTRLSVGDRTTPSPAEDPETADHGGVDASNVAMLTAMVQALRDSMPGAAPEPLVEAASPAPQAMQSAPPAVEVADSTPAAEDKAAAPKPEPEQAAAPEPAAVVEAPASANPDIAKAYDDPDDRPPARWTMAALPQPEFVSTPVEPPRAATSVIADPGPQPAPAPAPAHDPLHALKAMSENERLALFS